MGGRELLAQACGALDLVETLGEAIARDGAIVYTTRGVPRAHPAVKDQIAARAFWCGCWKNSASPTKM